VTESRSGHATAYHAPVLVEEVARLLGSAKTVLDGTLGGGGHAQALLERHAQTVVGVDRDADAIRVARDRLGEYERAGRFRAVRANYADIDDNPELRSVRPDAVLLDLGVSSHQLDAEERGFTFREGAPLDMRMGSGENESAADLLNTRDEAALAQLFREYADEPRAARLAREIVRRRATESFVTSDDLVRAIRGALGARTGPPDFARLFQALRIAVNRELDGLRAALPLLRDRLVPGGTLAVITYHSGEDRIVKHLFRDWSTDCVCPPRQPICTCDHRATGETITKRPIVATDVEKSSNPRARSAKLRAWRKFSAAESAMIDRAPAPGGR
jgi:16S rRNA (cytosine1402-N4)-methyltransferase